MRCPYCRTTDSRVVDSREANDGDAIRRRRACGQCGRRFTTVEETSLAVVKRSGVTEPFSRAKVIAGVRRACQGRPVDEDDLALLAQQVEDMVRGAGAAEVPAHEVGTAILTPLRRLDEVAYLRFASVYRSFASLDDFEAEITALRARARPRADPAGRTRPDHRPTSTPARPPRPRTHPPVNAAAPAVVAHLDERGTPMTETVSGAPRRTSRGARLRVERVYTTEGVHPYDEVTWERRDVVMTNWRDGSVNFEQRGVEFPESWSVNAANIVTTKYFRGAVGADNRESSLRQLIDRVVKKYAAAGLEHGYFAAPADAEVFEHELTWMLLHQVFSFNSPVWFNVGTSAPQQVSRLLHPRRSTTAWTRS